MEHAQQICIQEKVSRQDGWHSASCYVFYAEVEFPDEGDRKDQGGGVGGYDAEAGGKFQTLGEPPSDVGFI
jgi:hypothetical protein